MSRLILYMSVSLDGYIATRERTQPWLPVKRSYGGQRHRMNLELMGQVDALILGTGAYREFQMGWSTSDNPMAKLINALPKIVFSNSIDAVDWNNSRLAGRPVEEEIPALKEEFERDLAVFGGAGIAHLLVRHGLVDEYRLTVWPYILGDGLSFMHDQPDPVELDLVSSTAYTDGAVVQVLRPTA